MSEATDEEDTTALVHKWHPLQTKPFDPPRSRNSLPSWMSYSSTRQVEWTTCVWLRRPAPITGRPLFFNGCSTAITAVDTTYQPDMNRLPLGTLPWGWEEKLSLPSDERFADLVRRCASDTDPRLELDVAYVNGFLCRRCQRMVGDNISSIEHLSKDNIESPAILEDHHGSTVQSFSAAVKQGCYFCCAAQRAYEQASCLHPYKIKKYLMGPGSIICLSLECSAGVSCLSKLSHHNVFVSFEMLRPFQFKMLEPEYIPRTTVTSDSTIMGLASEWIQTCCTFHEICAKRGPCESKFLPTRLIDIGYGSSSSTWKLVLTRNTPMAPVEYIALSYCWGASTQLRLTATTQDSFIKGMPVSALTRTHQDVITVAKSLGIRWLWIDALCILQDSKSDWTRESLEMAEIYSNCKLAVAAAASSDSQGGLFRHRQANGLSPLILRQPNRAYLFHTNDYWGEHLEDCSPLFKRGWALQERLLPKRVLYFSQQQVFFECRFNRACEGFPCGGVGLSNKLENLSFFDTGFPEGGILSSLHQHPSRRVQIWSSMVNKYQSCDFTFPSDKLIALSGVIKTIELQTGDEFHAGLWKSRLLFYLGWNSRDRKRCRLAGIQTPSWSWMSMRGPIAWETEMEMMLNIDLESIKVPLNETMPLAHVIDISTERRSNKTQDQLRIEGHIRLKGSLVKARLLCSTSRAKDGGGIFVVTKYGRYLRSETDEPIYLLEMDMNPCLAEAFPDIDLSVTPQGPRPAKVIFHSFREGHEYNLFGHKFNTGRGETTSFRVVPMAAGDIFALPLHAEITKDGAVMSVVGLIVTQSARKNENDAMERVGMFRLAARVGTTEEDLSVTLGPDNRTYQLGGTPEPVNITLF